MTLFGAMVRRGRKGLAFTSGTGDAVRRKSGLRETPVLEFREQPGKGQLDPHLAEHREMVPVIVEDYAAEAGNAVVLIHEYQRFAAVVAEKDRREVVRTILRILEGTGGNLIIHGRREELPAGEAKWLDALARSGSQARNGHGRDRQADSDE